MTDTDNTEKAFDGTTENGPERRARYKRIQALGAILNQMFDHNATSAHQAVKMYVSEGPINRIMRSVEMSLEQYDKKKLSLISDQNLNVIRLLLGIDHDKTVHYKSIALLLGQTRADLQKIKDEFVGKYLYFRYYRAKRKVTTDSGKRIDLEYVNGRIVIYEDDGIPIFEHYREKDLTPRNSGCVFFRENKLYMLGFRENVMRLSITHTVPNQSKRIMHGVIGSVSDSERYPYASHFLLVSEKNKEEIGKLSDRTPINDQNSYELTFGEKYFVSRMPEQAYFIRAYEEEKDDKDDG